MSIQILVLIQLQYHKTPLIQQFSTPHAPSTAVDSPLFVLPSMRKLIQSNEEDTTVVTKPSQHSDKSNSVLVVPPTSITNCEESNEGSHLTVTHEQICPLKCNVDEKLKDANSYIHYTPSKRTKFPPLPPS